jgi:hypothetical protein
MIVARTFHLFNPLYTEVCVRARARVRIHAFQEAHASRPLRKSHARSRAACTPTQRGGRTPLVVHGARTRAQLQNFCVSPAIREDRAAKITI